MERDLDEIVGNFTKGHFNSHAHVERDDSVSGSGDITNNFNSHAHVERDYLYGTGGSYHGHFNSHAHVERDTNSLPQTCRRSFQLTRSRGA